MSDEIEIRYYDVPEQFVESGRKWLAGELTQIADPKPASTVMLVRDGGTDDATQVFMLRRVATMAFAPSTMVFPGGGVDPRDADPALPWVGPSPQEWAQLLDTDEASARELVVAAAREVFEECGVLLAGPDPTSVVSDVSGPQWQHARRSLLSREISFTELLLHRGLVFRADLLAAKAHWVTPEFEGRRYDTRFFAALVPHGQVPDDQTSEADVAGWFDPDDVLDAFSEGRAVLLPPTLVCLEQIAQSADARDFLVHGPAVRRIMPVLEATPDGARMRVELPR